jgi:exodeoxyribonuclease V alpha subunit
VVILPLYMQHYLLLSRNLTYTGLTRAKQLAIASLAPQVIVVGSSKAIGLAVGQRYTRLQERLKGNVNCQENIMGYVGQHTP